MGKNIIITGGLGYIGTELCKIYSGESWYSKITVIDNRFISERVNQLRNWNINFIQADITNSNIIKNILREANVVHHLAGITDVARTKSESDESKDKELIRVASEGTKIILSETPNDCKIIFPSSHVIFEGTSSLKKDISEKEKISHVVLPVSPLLFRADFIKKLQISIFENGLVPYIPLSGIDSEIFDNAKEIGLEKFVLRVENVLRRKETYQKKKFTDTAVNAILKRKKTIPVKLGPNMLHEVLDTLQVKH